MSSVFKDVEQLARDAFKPADMVLNKVGEKSPRTKEKKETDQKAADAKMEARKRLIPIQDPNTGKAEQRRKAATKKGVSRTSTMLSQNKETLG